MVSKCIGAMSGVRLFSEIHPDANHVDYMNVTSQAHRWYQLARQSDVDRRSPFVEGVKAIYDVTRGEGTVMVLRDWASIDFIGRILKDEPTYEFHLNKVLEPHFSIHRCALVRHPLDQWLSTRRLKIYAGKLTVEAFVQGYRRYAEAVCGCYVQYEQFTHAPEATMQRICELLELDYDPGFLDRWHTNTAITGDNKNSSRGTSTAEAPRIRPLPRREQDAELEEQLQDNADYQLSLKILGYQH